MKNRTAFRILCLIISLVLLFSASACHTDVSAATIDLLAEVEGRDVDYKPIDDSFSAAQTDFAVKIFKDSFAKSGSNTLVSPLSLAMALAMTANGADGKTRAEAEALLCNGFSLEDLNGYNKALQSRISNDKNGQLGMANSIWFRDSDSFKPKTDYLQSLADWYKADAYKAPFDSSTADDINAWVRKNTDGLIDKTVDTVDEKACMYLINAVCFDAEWETAFSTSEKGAFTDKDGKTVLADMMRSDEYKYLCGDGEVGFIKPYKDGRYSFAAVMPDGDIGDYIASLTSEKLMSVLKHAEDVEVSVKMPKFSYDFEAEMNDVLSAYIPTAFDPYTADFGNMATSDNNIYISNILHKTHISVNENGTEAAAVTKVEMWEKTSIAHQKSVVLDRPFVYLIIDSYNNIPIFFGAVTTL